VSAQSKPSPVLVTVRNPANGEIIGEYPQQSPEEVRAMLRRAHAVQPQWAAISLRERRECMARLTTALLYQTDDIAQLIADCVGKTRVEALATEVMPAVAGSRWYQRHADRYLRPQRLKNGSLIFFSKRSTVYRVPWGVVGIISPWNYPLGIPMHEIVPALLAGNAVVFKTAPETLPVGNKIAALMRVAGVPEAVFST